MLFRVTLWYIPVLGYTEDNTRSILEEQNSNTNANLTTCWHECQLLILKQSGNQFQSEEHKKHLFDGGKWLNIAGFWNGWCVSFLCVQQWSDGPGFIYSSYYCVSWLSGWKTVVLLEVNYCPLEGICTCTYVDITFSVFSSPLFPLDDSPWWSAPSSRLWRWRRSSWMGSGINIL